jgi:2-amino-4-hydroxy-6-hydroxymethyldihydropteridine diphosphokinase
MSLILGTGSNIGPSLSLLQHAKQLLSGYFEFQAASRVYYSTPVDYTDQPYFYNQVLQFAAPSLPPKEILLITQSIEKKLNRIKTQDKGPRSIDIDILFLKNEVHREIGLKIPHLSYAQRSFVSLPLAELPCFKFLKSNFPFHNHFEHHCQPI